MILLAVDPGSKRTGYCVSRGVGQVVDAGYLTPARGLSAADVVERGLSMADQVVGLMRESSAGGEELRVVVETPSNHAPGRGKARQGQANYGLAVGLVLSRVVGEAGRDAVTTVKADQWTRGRNKAARARVISALVLGYSMKADPGLDAADAIGLADWWWGRNGRTA